MRYQFSFDTYLPGDINGEETLVTVTADYQLPDGGMKLLSVTDTQGKDFEMSKAESDTVHEEIRENLANALDAYRGNLEDRDFDEHRDECRGIFGVCS